MFPAGACSQSGLGSATPFSPIESLNNGALAFVLRQRRMNILDDPNNSITPHDFIRFPVKKIDDACNNFFS